MANNNQTINEFNITQTTQRIQQNSEVNPKIPATLGNFLFGFIQLYRYAQTKEILAIVLGIFIGMVSGISHPIFLYLWFQQLNLAINNQANLTEYLDDFRIYLYYFIALGFGVLLVNSLLFGIWKYVSRSISKKIRIHYLKEFIKLSLPYLQTRNGYEWANDFKMHTLNIQKSIGDKVALLLNLIGIVVSGVTSAFIIRWTFSFYMLYITPLGIIILIYFIYIQIKKKQINTQSNKQAQNKALEATSMIKTVKMLNGEQKEAEDYQEKLRKGEKQLQKYNVKLGVATGLFYFVQYLFFGIGFLMGIQCVKGTSFCPVSTTGSRYRINEFMSVFFQIFFCTFNFLQLGSNYSLIKSAIQSSKKIYQFIDQLKTDRSNIQIQSPQKIQSIIFKKIHFRYPLNPQIQILKDLSLQFQPFRFNAIVGATGSGKSTIIQLLLKQYLPTQGSIQIDGVDLNTINASQWLDQVGIVTQEPVLFDGTIRQNILVGKHDATDQEIVDSLKKANIYKFVEQKKEGLDFEIGVGGSQLSGGQKQRIAIARALVKRPKLLILDQATSALDPATEQQIQASLQDIRMVLQNSVTIICIAHRTRTIRNADKIVLLQQGNVAEQGTYDQIKYFQKIQFKDKKENPENMLQRQQIQIPIQISKPLIDHRQQSEQPNNQISIIAQQKKCVSYPFLQLLGYTNRKKLYVLCLFLAVLIGGTHLASSILISYHVEQLNIFLVLAKNTNWCEHFGSTCQKQLDRYFQESQKYLYGLLGLAFFTFFPYFLQIYLLSKIENEIAFKLKNEVFRKILSLQVKFFEVHQNQSGGAASKFSNDSRDSSTLISTYIPILLCNFCIALGAVIICFSYDWRFGFLSLIVTPLIALSFYITMLFIGGYEDTSLQKLHKSDQTANQLITCMKTVLVLNYQKRFLQKYKRQIDEPIEDTIKVGGKIGFLYGLAFFILDVVVGLSLYISVLIIQAHHQISLISVCIYMIVSTLSGFIIGNNFYFIAHTSASKEAAARVMQILHTQSQEEVQRKKMSITESSVINLQTFRGSIQFRNISFKYKRDDSRLVLNNVSLTINPGEKVGFVGQSGCGKSTLLQLLLRFYQFQGQILVNGVNIYNYDLRQYRRIFSMLNQEPSLFAGTIEENIKYGGQISSQRLNQICENACAYTLDQDQYLQLGISRFRQRKVGPKGSNISGGEKQRVACARAFARNSQIFLMDEGTSALDMPTEAKVQKGVAKQFHKKTVITVAHRTQTIDDSHCIFVFSNGELIEFGNPKKLMKIKGHYYHFVHGNKMQS